MLQKESNSFTGFIAHYDKGVAIKEKENYFSKILGKQCATSWGEINKKKLVALELVWRNQSIIKIDKETFSHISDKDWFFSQSAMFEMKNRKIVILSRNIGYKKDNITQVFSVEESTGRLSSHVRAS